MSMENAEAKFVFLRSYCTSAAAAAGCPCIFKPGITSVEITRLEREANLELPNELRDFYQFSYGALICEYEILTIPETANLLLKCHQIYEGFDKSILPFAYLTGVGDIIAFDLMQEYEGNNMILDGFHELPPSEWKGICFGLLTWLEKLAQNKFEPFWLIE